MDHDNYVRVGTNPQTMELVFFNSCDIRSVSQRVQDACTKVGSLGATPHIAMWKQVAGLNYSIIGETKNQRW